MLASVATFALEGVDGQEVTVEVDVRRGLPAFTLVGLPDRAVRESRERVRAALLNSGLDFPQKRITVNLAPAHVRKAGPSFDLAIAVGAAGGQPAGAAGDAGRAARCCGELSLSGELRPVRGALAAALGARAAGYRRLLVPEAERGRGRARRGDRGAARSRRWRGIADLLHGRWAPEPVQPAAAPSRARRPSGPDLADVRGQEDAKRALEIAAAGGHNLLMIGPPGAGKTMLARRLPGHPAAAELRGGARDHAGPQRRRPRERAARHASGRSGRRTTRSRPQGLVGGGARPMPGEITLAHRGVLFLDELPGVRRGRARRAAPAARGRAREIMRGQRALDFPANAMRRRRVQPLPLRAARRTAAAAPRSSSARYQRRLSGPLLDRIDLVCQVEPVPAARARRGPRERGRAGGSTREPGGGGADAPAARLAGTGALCNGDMDGRLTAPRGAARATRSPAGCWRRATGSS